MRFRTCHASREVNRPILCIAVRVRPTFGFPQGHRLIHNAEFGGESLRLSCEATGGGGEIDGSDQAMPIKGRVSEGGEVLRGVASEDRAAVLIERRVAHVMHAVFDGSPEIADEGVQLVRVGASA